jgi:ubiquinone/menaquinone biosynthesis C-methylase UbiE
MWRLLRWTQSCPRTGGALRAWRQPIIEERLRQNLLYIIRHHLPHMDHQEIADIFDARAARYANDEWHRRYAEQLVDVTPLQPGDRVLDAGTGTGFAARAIARRVGPTGHVLGVDLSRGMLEQARRSIDAAHLTNVDLLEGDATDLRDLPASSVDAVVCSAGLLYMPVAKALAAWRRLIRPDGIVAFSAMRAGSPFTAGVFRTCAAKFGLQVTDRNEPLGADDRCRAVLEEAGFERVQVLAGNVAFERFDPTLAWEANFRAAGHAAARALSADQQEALRQQFFSALEEAGRADPEARARADVLFAIGHNEPK